MPDYKTMYYQLFNKVTDAVRLLQEAQNDAEESYTQSGDRPIITLLERKDEGGGDDTE